MSQGESAARVGIHAKKHDSSHEMCVMSTTRNPATEPSTGPYNAPSYASSNASLSSSTSSIFSGPAQDETLIGDNPASQNADPSPRWLHESTRTSEWRRGTPWKDSRFSGLVSWLEGPSSARTLTIEPLFPKFQQWPQAVLTACFPGRTTEILVVIIFVAWLIAFSTTFAVSVRQSSGTLAGSQPLRLECTSRLWPNSTFCGLDGHKCQPFNDSSFTFICPSNCASVQVLEPHTIGNQEVIYRSMVIGGPAEGNESFSFYRGDSFICAAAIHAGIISNEQGGCGNVTRQGQQRQFTASKRHGISSIGFQSSFPLSFSFDATNDVCLDPQWLLFTESITATILTSLLASSSGLFFASTFTIVFSQVALASDSPYYPDLMSVISVAFERGLPAAFVAWVLYKYCVRRTLYGLKAHFEKSVLWLGGCWIGALNNYTFDKIPISRLTPHDLQQQPGAITALIIIVVLLILVAVGQAWAFRTEGRLLRYLGLYLTFGIIIGCLIAMPGLQFRLHHYVLALLLLPGTSLQTRPSLLYQGILVGLFINGVARWGFASILQTAESLRGDGQLNSALPLLLRPDLDFGNITFTLPEIARGFNGYSVLVNDVERFQQHGVPSLSAFSWNRTTSEEPTFFRFAFTGTNALGGLWYGDYTKPGTWYGNGTWEDIKPGPSR